LQVGILQPGDQLPTVKEVVALVAINPNTVFKAYHELEMLGLAEGRTGSGTFVLERPAGPVPAVQEALAKDLSGWIAKAQKAGLDEESIEALVRATLHK
jgi:GntR family transcriptional regulator